MAKCICIALIAVALTVLANAGLSIESEAFTGATAALAAPRPRLKFKGMTFTDDRYCPNVTLNSAKGKASLQHLATTGANFVSIVVTQYQRTVNSTEIFPIYGAPVRCSSTPHGYCSTATDAEVAGAIAYAHQLGMGVMLKLQIDLTDEPTWKIWRGDIGTNMTDAEWALWFASYTAAITHYARIANATAVELFSVSCELVTASKRDAEWRDVVAALRHVYSGLLTDAANWSPPQGQGEVTDKTWWDIVDLIGVDEYFVSFTNSTPNADGDFPTLSELLKIWEPIEAQLQELHEKFNKSVIFTEVGYCSGVNGSCFQNGDIAPTPATTATSLAAQATQYEALLLAMSKHEWFEGVFWWNWSTDPAFGGNNNSCMDPKFKPAEDVLRRWYGATEPQPKLPAFAATCECWL